MSQCSHCGTITGQHSFSFGPDGKYSREKEPTWEEFQVIRVNALTELLKGIRIVDGHVEDVR